MSVPLRWPNAETVARQILAALAPAVTKLPADLADQVPMFRVRRIGGGDDEVTDYPRLAVDAFAGTYEAAWDLATDARELLLSGAHATPLGLVDAVSTEIGPQHVHYGNPSVQLVTAIYELQMRKAPR